MCHVVIVLFSSILGLYLTGGLTPKNIEYITGTKPGTENLFLGALLDKVRINAFEEAFPSVSVINLCAKTFVGESGSFANPTALNFRIYI